MIRNPFKALLAVAVILLPVSLSQHSHPQGVAFSYGSLGQNNLLAINPTATGLTGLQVPTSGMWVGGPGGVLEVEPFLTGVNAVTDASPAGFGQLGTVTYLRIAGMVIAFFALNYPVNSDTNVAYVAGLPYHATNNVSAFFGNQATDGFAWFPAAGLGCTFLQLPNVQAFLNHSLAGTITFTACYFTNDPP